MQISRHFVDIGPRRVHYRRCGSGPALLMVHQSPRSSAEYEGLMRAWGTHVTCIAPDTPGFGQSHPLPGPDPTINDFADAIVAFIDALGIGPVAAYGFHSGGIILVTALNRHPDKFRALAVGGYAIWTAAEMALFGAHYLPPFVPNAYGEHLVWLWNRMLEQSWFFPWFDVRPEARLSVAHADVARVDAAVREMLDAGDAYRAGYGAVLRAPRDIPPVEAVTPPVLITAYDGDPLQAHIDRLGPMPRGWQAAKVANPAEHHAASLAFLQPLAGGVTPPLIETADEGFLRVTTDDFDGLIHWRGAPGGAVMTVPAPGRSVELVPGFAIDPPGHGLSDHWPGEGHSNWAPWRAVFAAVARHFGITGIAHEPLPPGDADRLFPDLSPDRFGSHLTRAWAIVRAAHCFAPWYHADAAHARPFDPAALAPARLAIEHRALLQANAANALMKARQTMTGDDDGNP